MQYTTLHYNTIQYYIRLTRIHQENSIPLAGRSSAAVRCSYGDETRASFTIAAVY
jgi:hypothetical protein